MRTRTTTTSWHWMALMGATLAGAAGAQTMEEGAAPTRLMHCQREVAGAKGDRAQLLRACLNRRLEGERIVARDCQREAGAVAGALARHRAQQACERRALAVPSQELPKRPPPPPRPKVDPAGALPGMGPAGPGGAPTPAAGEQGGGVRP
ncbi:MAG: hypothetical protein KDF67_03690 [Ottowia sp.]|uniref:hypothetical protein n=1 Tax=Ottowia sp. TaxID=1898956 RepID=UPI001DE370FC|nr:hypothetical protein [Ottowia sp.]MCP5256601.1 hypothetical protein [Burkholderiaceae bacterium]MCB2023539.1 hypothetical protein [Ottowia sp.]MCB2032342.1 hypothetical protein [Ottowia sp.]MCB2068784.1 hypothetical protein [Ottowia sp.]HPK30969.1 hypothetical protein [Ottowia sp.]